MVSTSTSSSSAFRSAPSTRRSPAATAKDGCDLRRTLSSSSDRLETIDIIGPKSLHGAMNCPCCSGSSKARDNYAQQQVGRDALDADGGYCKPTRSNNDTNTTMKKQRQQQQRTTQAECPTAELDDDDGDKVVPGILSKGVAYTIRRTLVQGWVHKKGTGMDWIRSRSWKPRWASLVLAKVDGYAADVPLLLIYWYSSSPTPSSQILLSDSVVTVEDDPDTTKWNCYKFQIRHARDTSSTPTKDSGKGIIANSHIGSGVGNEVPSHITRNFTCPREGRDAWVYAINQALLDYEKSKAAALRKKTNPEIVHSQLEQISSPPRSPRNYSPETLPVVSPPRRRGSFDDDKFPRDLASPPQSRSASPLPMPLSPSFPYKRPLPRPESRLLGEGLLGLDDKGLNDDAQTTKKNTDEDGLQIPNDISTLPSNTRLMARPQLRNL